MRNSNMRLIPLVALICGIGWALSCGDTAHNDFGQTLQFDGFFTDATCGTGLLGVVLPLATGPAGQIIALQVTNKTTGIFIPVSTGGTAVGLPVPVNRGVRILIKNFHIEYLLPVGFIPPRDWVTTAVIPPLGEWCGEFWIISAEDVNNMLQDPLSYPPTPFTMNVRVTLQGVTEGGLDIEASGDIPMIVQ